MEIRNERNRSLEHSKRRVQEKENEEKEEMINAKDLKPLKLKGRYITITVSVWIGE
jgi:hypothetical protein